MPGPDADWTCDVARELLPRRLDDDLSNAEALALEKHLEGCPSCRDEARGLERAAEALEALTPEDRARLRERTDRELGLDDPFRRRSRLGRFVLVALSFVLVYCWLRLRPPGPLFDRGSTTTLDSRADPR